MFSGALLLFLRLPFIYLVKKPRFFLKDSCQFSSVQSLSRIRLFATPWTAASQASLSITNSWELAQTAGTIQLSHPLSSTFPPAFNFAQHQGLFQWVISSYQVAKVLELQLQLQSFQWIFRTDFLWDRLIWSPCGPKDSQESSPTPQFKSIHSLALSLLYGPTLTSITWLLQKP